MKIYWKYFSIFIQDYQKSIKRFCILSKLDNKKLYAAQGDTLGVQIYITWLDGHQFDSLCLFVKLLECDPTKPDKTVAATAEKFVSFLRQTLYLDHFPDKINITTDYAIHGRLGEELNNLGMFHLENKISVCGSHDGQNLFKNANKKMNMNIEMGDCQGK